MGYMKYCRDCQDYYPADIYPAHRKQHEVGNPSVEHKQYSGHVEKSNSDYMICVLHQKKCPCPVKDCNLQPFGCIRKSVMLKSARGIIGDESKINDKPVYPYLNTGSRKVEPFFPTSDREGNQIMIPIDMKTKTIVMYGVTIHLRI